MNLKHEIQRRYDAAGIEFGDVERDCLRRYWSSIRGAATEAQKQADLIAFAEGRIEGVEARLRVEANAKAAKAVARDGRGLGTAAPVGSADAATTVGSVLGF